MQRIKSFDLARGFTVLMIAPIHTVMLYSKLSVHDTLMGKLMAFIAEGPGAQLFMMLMGVFFALSPQRGFLSICKRAFYLLVAAYLLNIFKFVIPNFFGWLPNALLSDLNMDAGGHNLLSLLLIGDILHFAAIATIVLYILSKLPNARFMAIALATIMGIFSPTIWDIHSSHPVINYLLELAGGQAPQIFFPLFPWLVYPLIGFSLGNCMKNASHLRSAFWLCRDLGWILILGGEIARIIFPNYPDSSFYRTYPFDTMIHIGIVLITLNSWQWIHENVKPNHFFDLLTYMSRNITAIYLVQWVIICWLLPFFGYHQLGFLKTLCAIALTSSLTFVISFFFKRKTPTEQAIEAELNH
jgi:uncharacterized membrane protein